MCIARRLRAGGLATSVDGGAALVAQLGWAPRGGEFALDRLRAAAVMGPTLAQAAPQLAVAVPRALRFGFATRARQAAAARPAQGAAAILRFCPAAVS